MNETANSAIAKKPHVVYLTGLSINKKTLNDLIRQMIVDEDMEILLDVSKSHIKELKNEVNKGTNKQVASILGALVGMKVGLPFGGLLIGKLFEYFQNKSFRPNDLMKNLSIASEDFIANLCIDPYIKEKIDSYANVDFFNIYLSNQSDVRGLYPLTHIGALNNQFSIGWGYADGPFYENYFINRVKISFTDEFVRNLDLNKLRRPDTPQASGNDLLSSNPDGESMRVGKKDIEDNFLECLRNTFLSHGIDILLSRGLAESIKIDKKNEIEEGGATEKIKNAINSIGKKYRRDFIESMQTRSFFGIDLISRLLFLLVSLTDREKLKVKIEANHKEKAFLRELVCTAGDFEHVEIVDNSHDILIAFENSEPAGNSDEGIDYFINPHGTIDKWEICVPVKLILSLPLDNNNAPSDKILIPFRLDKNAILGNKCEPLYIITIGGAEHNRPLMHLVNLHRKQLKSKRQFGFLDNYFDHVHRLKDRQNDFDKAEFEHMFLMGVNQPVTGLNNAIFSRVNDEAGNSVSSDAKILYFKLNNNNREVYVLSVYGFSAKASGLSMLYAISNMTDLDRNDFFKNFREKHKLPNNGYAISLSFIKNAEIVLEKHLQGCDPFLAFMDGNQSELKKILTSLKDHDGILIRDDAGRADETSV